ncbi:hypothetical protein ACLOJK_032291 [Asimina triloba]
MFSHATAGSGKRSRISITRVASTVLLPRPKAALGALIKTSKVHSENFSYPKQKYSNRYPFDRSTHAAEKRGGWIEYQKDHQKENVGVGPMFPIDLLSDLKAVEKEACEARNSHRWRDMKSVDAARYTHVGTCGCGSIRWTTRVDASPPSEHIERKWGPLGRRTEVNGQLEYPSPLFRFIRSSGSRKRRWE